MMACVKVFHCGSMFNTRPVHILYEARGHYDLYFVYVSSRVTLWVRMGPALTLMFQVFRICVVPHRLSPSPFEEPLIRMLSFYFDAVLCLMFIISLLCPARWTRMSYASRQTYISHVLARRPLVWRRYCFGFHLCP